MHSELQSFDKAHKKPSTLYVYGLFMYKNKGDIDNYTIYFLNKPVHCIVNNPVVTLCVYFS